MRGDHGGRSSGDDFVAGVYPLLSDETCWFLAADFDKENWAADALAILETCSAKGVPAALERSRSGKGGHIWVFFSEPVRARLARQLGALLITATMERRPEIGFSSYDRFFPSQDVMPLGGFGNLIALPLQRKAREQGNSLFVDRGLRPYGDQWAFLSSLPRLSAPSLHSIVGEAEAQGAVLSVRLPADEEDTDEPWNMAPSRRRDPGPIGAPLPARVTATLADQLYLDRTELPPAMVARLVRVAAFQNPEFYRAQAMRLPTFGKPRIISCASNPYEPCERKRERVSAKHCATSSASTIENVTVGGKLIPCGAVLWTAGVSPSPLVKMLGVATDRAGRACVNPSLNVPDAPGVFVVGDAATLMQNGKPLPGVAQVRSSRAAMSDDWDAGAAEPVAHMLRAGGCGPHGSSHPTRSRQPVGITPYRDHPTTTTISFKNSLLTTGRWGGAFREQGSQNAHLLVERFPV